LTGENCGQKHLTDRCKLWTTAPYQQVQVVDTSFLLTGAGCEHKHLTDRYRLWTQASYWQVPVVGRSFLLTGASCGRVPTSESANRLFRLSGLAHTIDPPPHLPQHTRTHFGNTSVNIN